MQCLLTTEMASAFVGSAISVEDLLIVYYTFQNFHLLQ